VSAAGAPSGGTALRLLIDTNVFIALEPYAGRMEPGLASAAQLVRLVGEQRHRLFVHPATQDDLHEGKDKSRLTQQLAELAKFPKLAEGKIPSAVTGALGEPVPGSNDQRDLRLLAALFNNAVSFLITEDGRLRRRAARLGLRERVLTLADAVAMLRQLTPTVSTPPPRVDRVEPYALDAEQAIFASLREDYSEFDEWLNTKVRPDPDNRDCFVVHEEGCYAALTIVKRVEDDCPYSFPQPVTKIATFKVSAGYVGSKYGELLLKTLFNDAHDRGAASLYVEVLSKHEALVDLLSTFGFTDSGLRTLRDELVMAKVLQPLPTAAEELGSLDYHIAYGPPAIRPGGRVFVIPIQPHWHAQLFPDAPSAPPAAHEQLTLLPDLKPDEPTHPWGNALRKAYLSNSKSNLLSAGDVLLFYRSRDAKSVSAVGIVEAALRSSDPVAIMSFVERRTVYTPTEIAGMCARVGGVLAILFRQDRFIEPPWELAELQHYNVVTTWPQSITQVRDGGAKWVHQQLVA
jgi:hypothetical protein